MIKSSEEQVKASNSADTVEWSSDCQINQSSDRRSFDRREGADRRQHSGRSITVPDMRLGDRRMVGERRKVRIMITGRAMDI